MIIEEIQTKKCSGCGKEKLFIEFYKKTVAKDGNSTICKFCSSNYNKTYYELNRKELIEHNKNYYETNKEKIKIRKKIFNQDNKEEIKEIRFNLRKNNPLMQFIISAKNRAKKNKLEFALTKEDLLPLPKFCPILEIELEYSSKDHQSPNSASLDRINSQKGYIKGNVRIISMKANSSKSDSTKEEYGFYIENFKKLKQNFINLYNSKLEETDNGKKIRARKMLESSRERSKKKILNNNLTYKQILNKCLDICPISGIPLNYENNIAKYNSPSLDRFDNNLGYEDDNCFVISLRANTVKSNLTIEEMEFVYQKAFEPII